MRPRKSMLYRIAKYVIDVSMLTAVTFGLAVAIATSFNVIEMVI